MSESSLRLRPPHVGLRIWKTLGSVLLVALLYEYALGGRNPCFACIGAVFGMGSFFQEGMRAGGNRFVGTLLGGLIVIPFYWLYHTTPLGLPDYFYLLLGLFCVIYVNPLFGATSAIHPGSVVYFVVLFTVTQERYLSYTVARIIDTGIGVLISLAISRIFPSPKEPAPSTRETEAVS